MLPFTTSKASQTTLHGMQMTQVTPNIKTMQRKLHLWFVKRHLTFWRSIKLCGYQVAITYLYIKITGAFYLDSFPPRDIREKKTLMIFSIYDELKQDCCVKNNSKSKRLHTIQKSHSDNKHLRPTNLTDHPPKEQRGYS